MQSQASPEPVIEPTPATPSRPVITEPDFSGSPQPIAEFAIRADFPQCTLGAYVDIRGFAGVVVEIVNQSIKITSPDGITQRFNADRLKTLCAPPQAIDPVPTTRNIDRPKPVAAPSSVQPKPVAPPRVYIAEPDFSMPVSPITDYAGQPDFPKCAYGKHVDVAGYTGVVAEIVKGSLKIQSPAGTTRSYNAEVLRKLYSSG